MLYSVQSTCIIVLNSNYLPVSYMGMGLGYNKLMPGIENSTNKLIKQKHLCRYSFHWDDVFILLNCQKFY